MPDAQDESVSREDLAPVTAGLISQLEELFGQVRRRAELDAGRRVLAIAYRLVDEREAAARTLAAYEQHNEQLTLKLAQAMAAIDALKFQLDPARPIAAAPASTTSTVDKSAGQAQVPEADRRPSDIPHRELPPLSVSQLDHDPIESDHSVQETSLTRHLFLVQYRIQAPWRTDMVGRPYSKTRGDAAYQ